MHLDAAWLLMVCGGAAWSGVDYYHLPAAPLEKAVAETGGLRVRGQWPVGRRERRIPDRARVQDRAKEPRGHAGTDAESAKSRQLTEGWRFFFGPVSAAS